jgi:hypothetical protein
MIEHPKNYYKNASIYIIKSPNTDMVYIGSTSKPIETRFKQHICNCKRKFTKKSTSSWKVIEKGDAYIEYIEKYPCLSNHELCKKENEHIFRNRLDGLNVVNVGGRYPT